MRITLASYGSVGDILPLVALAVGLRDAGHRVVTVGDQAGSEIAIRHGLEFHAFAGSFQRRAVPSAEAETRRSPSGRKATSFTAAVCPLRACCSLPSAAL